MSKLSRERKLLLIVGLVVAVLCAIGVIVQGAAYRELAGGASYTAPQAGGLGQALEAWNSSTRAQADEAWNMLLFMIIGCAVGCALIFLALRKPKPVPEVRQDPIRPESEPYREDEPLLVSPEGREPERKSRYWEDLDEDEEEEN